MDDDGALFEAEINALAASGITQGCSAEDFCPTDDVTRGELAAFLFRAGDFAASDADFFPDDDGGIFEDEIDAIAEAGIVVACADGTTVAYCASELALRDQMASYLARFLGLEPLAVPPPEDTSPPGEEEGVGDEEAAGEDGEVIGADPWTATVEEAIAHWFPEVVDEAAAVVWCESRNDPEAVNPVGGFHGIFQLGEQWHVERFARITGETWQDAVYVPWFNAQYARDLYDGYGWSQWTCQP